MIIRDQRSVLASVLVGLASIVCLDLTDEDWIFRTVSLLGCSLIIIFWLLHHNRRRM